MDPAAPAPAAPSEPEQPAPGFNWPNAVLLVATGCLVAVVAGALAQLAAGRSDRTWLFLAMFMACFAVFKLMVAMRAVREVRLVPAGGIDPRVHFGTPGRFWVWVGVKIVVFLLAMTASAVIVIHGPGSLR
jgi:hypothetical protein